MMGLLTVDGLTFADVAIIAGIAAYLADRTVDALGWSRSSRTLRRENEDLVRRNVELEQTTQRHEVTIATQGSQIELLTEKVRELEKRDQAAVLSALERHETNAATRHDRGEVRHGETVDLLRGIRDALTKEAA